MSLTDQYRKDFQKTFASFGASGHSLWQVWEDFLILSSGALAGTVDQFGRTVQYKVDQFKISWDRYTEDEHVKFSGMFNDLANAFEVHPEQDFLGEIFMDLGIADKWKGQFFTPYCLADVLAGIDIAQTADDIKEHGWGKIMDPTCGAGVTMIAARNQLQTMNIGSDRVLFIGQDISTTAVMMCHIQLSLMGCAGYVLCADTLTNPLKLSIDGISPVPQEGQTFRFTPAWFTDVWQGRMAVRFMEATWKISSRK